MTTTRRHILGMALGALAMLFPGVAFGQQRRNRGMSGGGHQPRHGAGAGAGAGMGTGAGAAADPLFAADQKLIQGLFSGSQLIRRDVVNLPNGVETLTETGNFMLQKILVLHVKSMKKRVEDGRGFHLRDPLFRELFSNANKIRMDVVETPGGVRVQQTSDDPYVVKLIQRHAEVVSMFLKNGPIEAHRAHTLTT